MSCGASPVGHRRFCRHCGAALNPEQVVCVRCGSQVTGRPAGRGTVPAKNYDGTIPMPNGVGYLIWSIISTLLCCLPLGVVGIIFSINCMNDVTAGRYDSAVKNSKVAFWCNIISLIGGLIIGCIFFLIGLAEGM
jgi:hypothetical protein